MSVVHICVRIPTETSASTSPSAASSNNECRKCGITKKSHERSCCARDGAWFKNCGDAGDTDFDHTWVEGIQACAGRSEFCLSTFIVMETASVNVHVSLAYKAL